MTTRFKDANECLQNAVAPERMAEALHRAEFVRPEHLVRAGDIEADIYEEFYSDDPARLGLPLPFGDLFPFRVRQRELTIWTGYAGHGKTQCAQHVLVHLACDHKERVFIAPLESTAPTTFELLIRQSTGLKRPFVKGDRAGLHKIVDWLGDRFWIYGAQGAVKFDDLLAAMKYVRQRYNVRQFLLDNLMMLTMGVGNADQQVKEQDRIMQLLKEFHDVYDCHIHLVAHSKKPQDKKGEGHIPRQYDILGSSVIPNLAWNVIVVWRNKQKEQRLIQLAQEAEMMRRSGKSLSVEEQEEIQQLEYEKDAFLICDKQRRTGRLPVRNLFFNPDSLQFRDDYMAAPRRYFRLEDAVAPEEAQEREEV